MQIILLLLFLLAVYTVDANWSLKSTYFGDKLGMNLGSKVDISPEGNLFLASTSKGFILLELDEDENFVTADDNHSEFYGSFQTSGYPLTEIKLSMGSRGKFLVSNYKMGHNPNGYFQYGECKFWKYENGILENVNTTQGQSSWNRTYGKPADNSLGIITSLSDDGERMFLATAFSNYGVPKHNPDRSYPELRFYQLLDSDWVETASEIPNTYYNSIQWYPKGNVVNPYGNVDNEHMHGEFDGMISGDGNSILFSNFNNNRGEIHVRTLENIEGTYNWQQKGQLIVGENEYDEAKNFQISYDGNIVITGSSKYDFREDNFSLPIENCGIIRTYNFDYLNEAWVEFVDPIIGDEGKEIGRNFCLSGDGKTLALASSNGLEIYNIGETSWQLSDIIDISDYNYWNVSFSLDYLGRTILIGKTKLSGTYGSVSVYRKSGVQIDSDQDGIYDYDEVIVYKTNINDPDSNADGLNDGVAISLGLDPNTNNSNLINYISNNLEEFDIETADYTQAEYDIAIITSWSSGQNQIINNPSNFNLISLVDHTEAVSNSRASGQYDVISNPSEFNLFTQSQLTNSENVARNQGIEEVQNNPTAYNLFGMMEFLNYTNASRLAGQNDVLNNPNNYNLFSLEEVTTVYGVEESVYDDLLESRDNAIAEKNLLQANLNEYENYELPRIDINDVLTTWLGYVYDPTDDVHKVDPNVDVDQNKLQYLAHFRGILDEGPLSEELKDDVLLGLRVAINHKISREYWKARAKSQPTQAQYESAIAATNTGYTLEEIRDLRPGSSLLEIVDGKANIIMEVEESDDLNIWTTGGTASIELPIEAGSEKKFYRFKISDDLVNQSENSAFSIIEGSYTWEEARLDAESRGGKLAVLNTQEKINAANQYLNNIGVWPVLWIGASDSVVEGQWKWLTGESVVNPPWGDNEPGGSGEDYMAIWHSGAELSQPLLWSDWPNGLYSSIGGNTGSYLLEMPQ